MFYEKAVQAELAVLTRNAKRLDVAFDSEIECSELLERLDDIDASLARVEALLPFNPNSGAEIGRHTGFLRYYLEREQPEHCRRDASQLVTIDIPKVKRTFETWCQSEERFDAGILEGTRRLFETAHFDSATRKAFVILKERLCEYFDQPDTLDGAHLANAIFGQRAPGIPGLPDNKRQAWRDLLAGLYGVFRNRLAHENHAGSLREAAGVVAIINAIIHELDELRETSEDTA